MDSKHFKQLFSDPNKQSTKKRVAFLNESIYGSVTALAVNVGMVFKPDVSAAYALITVASTIGGLWLASIFAAVTSYRIVHDKRVPRSEFFHELTIHRGLLLPIIPASILYGLAIMGVIENSTAVIAVIALAAVATTVTIIRSGKTRTNSYTTALISIGAQIIVAAAIVFVKLGSS